MKFEPSRTGGSGPDQRPDHPGLLWQRRCCRECTSNVSHSSISAQHVIQFSLSTSWFGPNGPTCSFSSFYVPHWALRRRKTRRWRRRCEHTHLGKSSLCVEAERLGSLGGSNAHNKDFRGVNTNEEWRDEMRRVCGVKNEKAGDVERWMETL